MHFVPQLVPNSDFCITSVLLRFALTALCFSDHYNSSSDLGICVISTAQCTYCTASSLNGLHYWVCSCSPGMMLMLEYLFCMSP